MQKINPEQWGYAGVWAGDFRCWEGDAQMNQLRFLVEHGFTSGTISLNALKDPVREKEVGAFVQAHGLRLSPGFHANYFTDSLEELCAHVDAYVEKIRSLRDVLNIRLVHTGAGNYHRFMREPTLTFQMERLRAVLGRLSEKLAALGVGCAIENHIDYYCSDLVELCASIPPLGILLDTGNCAGIGEKPIEGCREAIPYVLGTHLKDFYLAPNGRNLSFDQAGATFGEGDIGLETILTDLLTLHPNPEVIDFQWEWIPDKNVDAFTSIERSWEFCRRFTDTRS